VQCDGGQWSVVVHIFLNLEGKEQDTMDPAPEKNLATRKNEVHEGCLEDIAPLPQEEVHIPIPRAYAYGWLRPVDINKLCLLLADDYIPLTIHDSFISPTQELLLSLYADSLSAASSQALDKDPTWKDPHRLNLPQTRTNWLVQDEDSYVEFSQENEERVITKDELEFIMDSCTNLGATHEKLDSLSRTIDKWIGKSESRMKVLDSICKE